MTDDQFRAEISEQVRYLLQAVQRMAEQPEMTYRIAIANDITAIFSRYYREPDPLVEVWNEVDPHNYWDYADADRFREAMKARGYEWCKIDGNHD